MKSLRELILGETKLQKVLRENRAYEPILEDKNYYEVLEQLDETNDLYKSDTRVKNKGKGMVMGLAVLGASALVTDLLIKQDDLKTILGAATICGRLITTISMFVSYEAYQAERKEIGKKKRGEL